MKVGVGGFNLGEFLGVEVVFGSGVVGFRGGRSLILNIDFRFITYLFLM